MPSKFSILIIEDDDDARSNMEDILSLDGYEIVTASHCLPAINAIETRHFDAVIVDWRLPDGSGGDLIPIIKQEIPNSPVVVVTGMREFDTAVSALRSGAYDFLTKPINPDALRMLISRIVERKSHLVEIESSQERLVANERLAAIGQMVAGLAHESRNAFQRSHACLAELTLDLESMPESLTLVHKVQKALDDLNFLLEEVREYSAPIILERRQINLGELVTETWQQILDAKQATAPEISISVAANVPPSCYVDRERLGQVFRNLLENARFACRAPGKIQVDIEAVASLRDAPPTLAVTVLDDGEGVPDDYRDEIFNPFFTTKTKGTGLGLAICRRIVEAHQGHLDVVDHPGDGAKFVVSLPLKQRPSKQA